MTGHVALRLPLQTTPSPSRFIRWVQWRGCCIGEIRTYTAIAREAQAVRRNWLEAIKSIDKVSNEDLVSIKAVTREAAARQTVDDVAEEFCTELEHEPARVDELPVVPREGGGVGGDGVAGNGGARNEGDANTGSVSPRSASNDDDEDADGAAEVEAVRVAFGDPVDSAAALGGVEDDLEADWAGRGAAAAAASGADAELRTVGDHSGEEGGTTTYFRTAQGEKVSVPMEHTAALALLRVRKWHMHTLTLSRGDGECVIPFGDRTRDLTAHPDFEADLGRLAYDDGRGLLKQLIAVRDGILPEILARYCNLAGPVQARIREMGMCIVWSCRNPRSLQKSYKGMYLCDDHLYADLRVRATGEVVRLCTKCHKLVASCGFEVSERTGKPFVTCDVCRARDKEKSLRAREGQGVHGAEEGGVGPVRGTGGADGGVSDGDDAAGGGRVEGEGDVALVPAVAHVHPEPPQAEVDAGRDDGGEYIAARRMCAVAAGEFRVGESLSNPYVVLAHHHPARVRGKYDAAKNPRAQECVNVTCTNAHAAGSRTAATLCSPCKQVRVTPLRIPGVLVNPPSSWRRPCLPHPFLHPVLAGRQPCAEVVCLCRACGMCTWRWSRSSMPRVW